MIPIMPNDETSKENDKDYWRYTFAGMALTEMFRSNTAYSRDVSAGVKQCVAIADALLRELERSETTLEGGE